ncbi:MAG: hypothetical protein Q8P50_17650 [Bacillota bacterium]|nr:hypothetical protein [Bacillota bacterium]
MTQFMEKLQNIDRRILFALIFLAMAYPMVKPFTLPMAITQEVKSLYDFIEKLGPDDIVIMAPDYSPAYAPTVGGACDAIYVHLMRRGAKVVFASFAQTGPMMAENVITSGTPSGKKYGVDYVNMGFRAGGEGAVASMLQDFPSVFPKDFQGTPIAGIPMLKNLKSAKDLSLAVLFATGGYAGGGWVRQLVQPYGKPFAACVTGMMGPAHVPYYQAKQLVGLVVDMKGGAEYETLIKRPSGSLAGMGAQTLAQMLIVLYMVVANVTYFTLKKERSRTR